MGTLPTSSGSAHLFRSAHVAAPALRRVRVVLEAPVDLPLRDLVRGRVRVRVRVRARVVVVVRVRARVVVGVRVEVRVRVRRSAAPVPRRAAGIVGSAG
eukprot:scaffold42933_cov27-Phaeocystis_antarctica.AAC.1